MEIEHFNKILDRDYQVKSSEYISQGYDLFKANAGNFIGFLIVLAIFSSIASAVPYVGSIISTLVSTFLYLGLYKAIRKMKYGQGGSFNDFFDGFKMDAGQVIAFAIVNSIVLLLGFVLLIIPGIYLAVAYTFALPILSITGKDFWGAMEVSRKVISRNWFSFFGFLLLLLLLNFVGAICLLIGLFVTIPVTFCAIYLAFEDICEVQSLDEFESKLDQLGKPDQDQL